MMTKHTKGWLAVGALAVGAGIGTALHGYLDVMYREDIPQGIIKRIMNKKNDADMDEFGKFTAKNCEWINQQDIETIDLQNDRGFTLKGYLLSAQKKSDVFVLFAHGYRADHLGDPANFEKYYHDKGYNFMSVDHTAAGESEGDFVGFDYYESRDMLRWIQYLVSRFGSDIKIILHGVSMGGATVCKMADSVPEQVRIIISDCAYTSALEQFDETVKSVGISKTGGLLKVFNTLNKRLAGYDLEDTNVRPSVIGAKAPMLFVHGGADDFVPTKMVYDLYKLCPAEKDLLIIENAGHAQSVMTGTKEYQAKLDEFIEKYLED